MALLAERNQVYAPVVVSHPKRDNVMYIQPPCGSALRTEGRTRECLMPSRAPLRTSPCHAIRLAQPAVVASSGTEIRRGITAGYPFHLAPQRTKLATAGFAGPFHGAIQPPASPGTAVDFGPSDRVIGGGKRPPTVRAGGVDARTGRGSLALFGLSFLFRGPNAAVGPTGADSTSTR